MTRVRSNKQAGFTRQERGFTMIEILVAIAVMGVVGVVTTGMLVTLLSWGDRVRAVEEVEESIKIMERTMKLSVEQAEDITGGGSSLLVTGDDECWSFVWDAVQLRMNYEHVVSIGCVPNPSPTGTLIGDGMVVSNLDFDIVDLALGGRQVRLAADIKRTYPLDSYERLMGITIVNYLIGEE